jgi:hypothetical protein
MKTALSRPNSRIGQLQRACLDLLRGPRHQVEGGLPTSNRTLFYELEGIGIVSKEVRLKADGSKRSRTDSQDVSVATMRLRETGAVPWDWIVDETRSLASWSFADSVYEYAAAAARAARIDCWSGMAAPLILSESRGVAGEQRRLAAEYLCPIAGTSGQVGGFLHTDVIPVLKPGQHVLYIGDWDWSGAQIEENTRTVLEAEVGPLQWERLAVTAEQIEQLGLGRILKRDRRYSDGKPHYATEVEEFGQLRTRELLRTRLDALMPVPLADVRVREERERDEILRTLRKATAE